MEKEPKKIYEEQCFQCGGEGVDHEEIEQDGLPAVCTACYGWGTLLVDENDNLDIEAMDKREREN